MNNLLSAADYLNAVELIIKKAHEIIPTEINRMLVSEWAEKNRTLKEGPFQGPFSFDLVPYLREIADMLSPSNTEVNEVVLMKPSRIGATVSVGENWIGATIDAFPCDMGYITSDGAMAEVQMQTRIDSLINESGIGEKIGDITKRAGQKKTMDKTVLKAFPGGTLLAGGPNSSFFKRSTGFKQLNVTEVDGFADNIGKEGDPVGLFRRRCGAHMIDYKILWESSPKLKHNSKILRLYKEGDQRKYFVPCRKCGHMQFLKWGKKDAPGGLRFEHDDEDRLIKNSVYYECESCGAHWKNSDKDWFLPRGQWMPTATPRKNGVVSYAINALYAPVGFVSWEQGATEWLEIKHNGWPKLELQVFINTFLGEAFEDRGERPRLEALLSNQRTYRAGSLPDDHKALFVTVGADIQKDRIECEIVAWGEDKASWSINYLILPGDTEDLESQCWTALRSIITTKYHGMQPIFSGIDSGYRTDVVYSFCDSFDAGVYPVMGSDNMNRGKDYIKFFNVGEHQNPRVDINTNLLKQEIYQALSKGQYESGEYPKGFCHFPADYDREHYNRLTAEQRVLQVDKYGAKKHIWDAGNRRNEQLDCRVYNLAMCYCYKKYLEDEFKATEQLDEDTTLSWSDFWEYLKK